jgi:hypothetical protein
MRKLVLLTLAAATLALSGCGGSDSNAFSNPPGSGGGGQPGTLRVDMGSGTGGAFQAGIIGISNANLSAGGSASLQVVLQRSDGTLFTESASITFNSPCVAQGLARIDTPVTTTTGIASATYQATGCSGQDVITASTSVSGTSLTASGTVTVAASAIGSIVFDSATPANIALRGTGGAGRPETSTVVFRVLDQTGGPRAGATVNFALNTQVGGITFSPSSATSDANGRVQTVVQGGTVSTTVRVTATVQNTTPAISTQSSQLTVTTGIPDQDSFSLAVRCQNVEAWNIDGVQVEVTARLADRFNNPVPDGTAVTFSAEGGIIQSQCTTASNANESGFCLRRWTSANPRPGGGPGQSGRVTIFATAIGEESFTDSNGNGRFDAGESWVDLGERFLDANENGSYDNGEQIYDFNNNSTRDPADNVFNGVLCNDPARCNANSTSTGIGVSNLIIMSDGGANRTIAQDGATIQVPAGGSFTFDIVLADLNGNPLPAGTTAAATVAGTGLTVAQPNSFTYPCTSTAQGARFTINATATAVDGTFSLLVTSPGGIQTGLRYPVDVL